MPDGMLSRLKSGQKSVEKDIMYVFNFFFNLHTLNVQNCVCVCVRTHAHTCV